MDLLWRNNIPPEQVNLGIAFYGRSFTLSDPNCQAAGCPFSAGGNAGPCTNQTGILSFTEIEAIINDPASKAVVTLDPVAAVQIVVWDTNQWVSFDNAESFALKLEYANAHCLGGTFVWTTSLDNDGTATDALRNITANDTFPGDDGSNNGSGDVYIGPDLWTNSSQSIGCIPPCTIVLPPIQLGFTSTVAAWPALTTSVLSSSAGSIYTKTTTIDIPPFEITEISFWAVTVVAGALDQVYFTPEQSVIPPSMIIELPGTEVAFPLSSTDFTNIAKSATSSLSSTISVSTPVAVQSGIATNCVQFYEAATGDGCDAIAVKFGITNAEFYAWNPSVGGSACSGLWLNEFYCVAIAGSGNTGPTVTTPAAVQTGIVSNCIRFYQASSGDGCNSIATKFGITDDQFYAWNPAIGGSASTGLWLGEYYCVAVATTSAATSSTTVVPIFFTSSHAITAQPQATSSIIIPPMIIPILSYGTGTPPPPSGGCSDVAKLLKLPGCGTHDCSIFGCGDLCGFFGCDGDCGFNFCGGGCGLGYCGPGCGEGDCIIPTGGGGNPNDPDSTSTETETESCTSTTVVASETVFATLGGTGTTSCFTDTEDCSTASMPPFAQYTEIDDPMPPDETDDEISADALYMYIATLMDPILSSIDPAQINGTMLSVYLSNAIASAIPAPTPTPTGGTPSLVCYIEGDPSATPEYWCNCGTTTMPTISGATTSQCPYTSISPPTPTPPTTTPAPTLPPNGFGYTYTDPFSNVIACAGSTVENLGAGLLITECTGSSSTVSVGPTRTTVSPSVLCTAVGTIFDGVQVYVWTNYVTDNGAALQAAENKVCGFEGLSGFSAFGTNGDGSIRNPDGTTWTADRMFHFTLNKVTHVPAVPCVAQGIMNAGGPANVVCPFEPALNAIFDELVDIFDEFIEDIFS